VAYFDCRGFVINDLHTILNDHRSKRKNNDGDDVIASVEKECPTISEIPDIFFDQVLVNIKLTRIEIIVLMYFYRQVWCRPNLYKTYGISQLMSFSEVATKLGLDIQEIYQSLRSLEDYGFISTVRSGQYFVRKYFTRQNDEKFNQSYDDFDF